MQVQSKTTIKTRIHIPTIIASGVSIYPTICVTKSLEIDMIRKI